MIAIPVMRGRVAPVLNWCSRIMIFPTISEGESGQELWVPELGPSERLQVLQAKGVNTLICGALSADLQTCAVKLGLRVIPGVAGEIGEILEAYRQNRLDQPEFWLPGCRGPRRYRQNLGNKNCMSITREPGGAKAMPGARGGRGQGGGGGQGQGGGRGGRGGRGTSGQTGGVSGVCVCPACGAEAPHQRGIPCLQMTCPKCGKSMVPK